MSDGQKQFITVPAAAKAMGVSRIVIDRAIKTGALQAVSFSSGGGNPGFRLIDVGDFEKFLEERGGYHSTTKTGGTQAHPWDSKINPESIIGKALVITNTSTVKKNAPVKKAKRVKKAAAAAA